MWKKAPVALTIVLAALFAYVQFRPGSYRIERAHTITAAPTAVYARLADLRTYQLWSPWEQLDAKTERTFDGPTEGIGATYRFRGDASVGEGRITLTEADPPVRALYRVEFDKPWRTVILHRFRIAPAEAGTTRLTWTLEGRHHFWGKLFALLGDVDKAVGEDMAHGLVALQHIVEGAGSS